ncbi:ABC transporter permease [Marinactinospora thermotolerans]|uniref:Osmoprotectant transport system permease protein n=1 Tax=Marinactinospora thermotolerans DSM 45154 TaxID=1122192 RepID=A0A1T4T8M4_9ACTN|nr:ABC transporter permease [Marinactinospora thermotolerans]SKA36611.1 osmoprotectant transport system permease protein [Marinactinospora thermotolerans DSM 45154]
MTLWEYIAGRSDMLAFQALQHASMIAQCVLVAAVVGVGLGVVVHRNERVAAIATGATSVVFTIPSLAMLGLLIGPFGLGVAPSVIAIVLYALLPILRNTIVGLNGVDPALVDAARGIGMSRTRVLVRVRLPLAWPVILTGLRVSTQLAMGIGAIAAFVSGPGLGEQIFSGLARLGAANALNATLVGTVGIVLLALLFDAVFVLIGKLTTSRGIRTHA